MTFTLDAVRNGLKLEDTESECVEKYVYFKIGEVVLWPCEYLAAEWQIVVYLNLNGIRKNQSAVNSDYYK
jgi:hypothetical protein